MRMFKWKLPAFAALIVAPFLITGCTTTGTSSKSQKTAAATSGVKSVNGVKTYTYTAKDKECLERAMFFESNRSSPDGLVAVGTVVMNRLASGKYSDTICGVVGQKNQFAPGVLSRRMESNKLPDVQAAADAVLKGKRHPKLKNAMFFHTAGLKFSYRNMHYVLVAGGNSFYEKRGRDGSLEAPVPQDAYKLAFAGPQSPIQSSLNSTPGTGETVQVALANVAANQAETQSDGYGPRAKGSRVVAQVPVPGEPPVQLAAYQPLQSTSSSQAEPQSLGYTAVDEKQVDAIGALLLSQDRPETPL